MPVNQSAMRTFLNLAMLSLLLDTFLRASVHGTNLTNWQEHKRPKRFILYENSGICKLVCGITYPVDLNDKKAWRQLVMTYNLQYQFPVPSKPIYWWDRFEDRALGEPPSQAPDTDLAQSFLYVFIEELMNRRAMNGHACLQLAICENAQLHGHRGLFSEILHRILIPHKSLDAAYSDAYHMGRHGTDCRAAFPLAKNCLLDSYSHVFEEQGGRR